MHHTSGSTGEVLRDDESTSTLTWTDDGCQSRVEVESQTTQVGFWVRLTSDGEATVGFWQSIKAIVLYSWLNVLFIVIPFAWVAHFMHPSHEVIFALCVFAMMPLIKMLHHLGDQLALNCGKAAGEVITVTVYNSVETVLAIVLLAKCELQLLQSTITGFILLRILFVSGAAFITGGLRRKSQALHPHRSQLNQTLLLAGFVCSQTIFVCFLRGTSEPLHYCYLHYSIMLLTIIPTSCQVVYTCPMLSMNRCKSRS